jgi:arylsulfatase
MGVHTPFKMWKRYNFEGGVADPLIVSWPKGMAASGELRHQFLHATDVVPTMYDLLGVDLPEVVKGYPQIPLEAGGFRSTFESDDVPTARRRPGFFSMLGSLRDLALGAGRRLRAPDITGWATSEHDRWELYDTTKDLTESTTGRRAPGEVQELINLWFHAAGTTGSAVDQTASRCSPTRPAPRCAAARPLRLLPGHGRGAGDGASTSATAATRSRSR